MRLLAIIILLVSCGVKQEKEPQNLKQTVVYKTNGNYDFLVPVILNNDKTAIVSYPHMSDLKVNGKFTYPEKLVGGYLLDKKGINANVAFLKFTYEEYTNFKEVPSLDTLYESITDKNPIKEIYICGQLDKSEIVKLIKRNRLKSQCK
jgi:hypothetical protein